MPLYSHLQPSFVQLPYGQSAYRRSYFDQPYHGQSSLPPFPYQMPTPPQTPIRRQAYSAPQPSFEKIKEIFTPGPVGPYHMVIWDAHVPIPFLATHSNEGTVHVEQYQMASPESRTPQQSLPSNERKSRTTRKKGAWNCVRSRSPRAMREDGPTTGPKA